MLNLKKSHFIYPAEEWWGYSTEQSAGKKKTNVKKSINLIQSSNYLFLVIIFNGIFVSFLQFSNGYTNLKTILIYRGILRSIKDTYAYSINVLNKVIVIIKIINIRISKLAVNFLMLQSLCSNLWSPPYLCSTQGHLGWVIKEPLISGLLLIHCDCIGHVAPDGGSHGVHKTVQPYFNLTFAETLWIEVHELEKKKVFYRQIYFS